MIISSSESSTFIKCGYPSPVYELEDKDKVVSSSGSTTVVDRDAVLTRTTGTIVDKNKQIVEEGFFDPIYESLDLTIATVDANGLVSRVSNGSARINVSVRGNKQQLEVPVTRVSGETVDQLQSWSEGSVAKHATDKIIEDLEGKSPTDDVMNFFSSYNHGSKQYVRNENLWLDIPKASFTGMSVWNVLYGQIFPCTAITPRHVVCCKHVGLNVGTVVRFVDSNNITVERTITAVKDLTGDIVNDHRVCLLNSALPNSITPIKLLPSNFANYIPNVQYRIPCIIRNQYLKCTIFDLVSFSVGFNAFDIPSNPITKPFYQLLTGGDSGSGAFLVINNQLAMVTKFSYSTKGLTYHDINWGLIISQLDAQVGISTNLLPQYINLSNFDSY